MSTSWVMKWRYSVAPKATKPGIFRLEKGGYLIRVGNTTRALPDASLNEAIAERQKLRTTKPKPSKPAFAEFATLLFDERVLLRKIKSRATRERWESNLRLYLIPFFGMTPLDEIDCMAFVKEMAKWIRDGKPCFKDPTKTVSFKETTANGILRTLQTICSVATIRHRLDRNPFAEVEFFEEKPTHSPEAPNALPPEIVAKFLAAARAMYPQYYMLMLLGFVTGLRPSSLRPLRKHVDILWATNQLIVRRSNSRGDEIMEQTKTGHYDVITLPQEIVDLLWEHLQKLPKGPMRDSEFLFPSETGGMRSRSVLAKPFEKIVKNLNVPYRVTPKAMRRSFQDLARAANIKDVVTRSISGHRTEQMQGHYSTVWSSEQRDALGALVKMVTS